MSRRRRHWSYHGEKRRLAIFRRDNYHCQINLEGCLGVATEIDHIIPKAWGGSEQPDNLRAACSWCNNRRNDPKQRNRSFSSASDSRAPLRNLPLFTEHPLKVADYSRRESKADDG